MVHVSESLPDGIVKLPETLSVDSAVPIHLRLAKDSDAEAFYQMTDTYRAQLGEYQQWAVDATPASIRDAVKWSITEIEAERMARYRIVLDETDAMIGEVSFYNRTGNHTQMGYFVIEPYQGKGIISASARSLIQYGFDSWGLESIELDIRKGHTRSEYVAQAIGATLTDRFATEGDLGRRVWEIHKS